MVGRYYCRWGGQDRACVKLVPQNLAMPPYQLHAASWKEREWWLILACTGVTNSENNDTICVRNTGRGKATLSVLVLSGFKWGCGSPKSVCVCGGVMAHVAPLLLTVSVVTWLYHHTLTETYNPACLLLTSECCSFPHSSGDQLKRSCGYLLSWTSNTNDCWHSPAFVTSFKSCSLQSKRYSMALMSNPDRRTLSILLIACTGSGTRHAYTI